MGGMGVVEKPCLHSRASKKRKEAFERYARERCRVQVRSKTMSV